MTTVTYNRIPWFRRFDCATAVVGGMRDQDIESRCETIAWILMPDHLHWLFVLQGGELSSLVARFKQSSAHRANQIIERQGQRFWQQGFHDRAVRKEDDVRAIARYIVSNPLRAGLVENIGDYPFWDAIWL